MKSVDAENSRNKGTIKNNEGGSKRSCCTGKNTRRFEGSPYPFNLYHFWDLRVYEYNRISDKIAIL